MTLNVYFVSLVPAKSSCEQNDMKTTYHVDKNIVREVKMSTSIILNPEHQIYITNRQPNLPTQPVFRPKCRGQKEPRCRLATAVTIVVFFFVLLLLRSQRREFAPNVIHSRKDLAAKNARLVLLLLSDADQTTPTMSPAYCSRLWYHK